MRCGALSLLVFSILVALCAVAVAAPGKISASRCKGSVSIDGRLDEACWQNAQRRSGFWQRHPHPGKSPRFNTEFRVVYDDDALYVGVRAHDPHPDQIRGLLTRRDQDSASDWIVVGVDSYHDKRTSFSFALNPAGVQRDFLVYDDSAQDSSWNAVWDGSARVDDKGWVAELRIPYSQLRFSGGTAQTWGLQVMRVVQRTREETVWRPWPKSSPQIVSKYGTLTGLRGIQPGKRIELLPYTLGGAAMRSPDSSDPYHHSLDPTGNVGVDLEYGLTPGLTLAATINPDFGQVEADPSQVNLTDNEVYLSERRPFFLEGADIFRFGLSQGDGGSGETLFYSRRIGAPPSGGVDGDWVDSPAMTTIYGALKVSGKTSGGWSIGLLDAVTAEERGHGAFADGSRVDPVVEPLTNYSVLRLRRDFNGGRSNVGMALTSVHRRLAGTDMDWLHDQAYSGGLQLTHRFGSNRWSANARLVGSYVHGTAAAIDETQRASQRYMHRPDADHLDYDPNRTSLTGAALIWSLVKDNGGHWRYGTGSDTRTPGFEVNDLGFQRISDSYVQWLWTQYRDDDPGRLWQSYAVNLNAWTAFDYGGTRTDTGGNFNANGQLRSFWSGYLGAGYNLGGWSTRGLRGGPAMRTDPAFNAWIGVTSDNRKKIQGTLNTNVWARPRTGSYQWGVNPVLTVQARSNLALSLGPSLSVRREDIQYVAESMDTTGLPHYTLARIRQTTTGMTMRASYTVSPRLSLQLYAQPFVSTGAYSRYKEVRSPRARDYDRRFARVDATTGQDTVSVDSDGDGMTDYVFDRPDFSFRQLRSNVVVRWEYRSGSTLFLIWSHGRTSVDSDGGVAFGDNLSALGRERGEHVVLFKLNYWLGL
jgi:hypothetical protein